MKLESKTNFELGKDGEIIFENKRWSHNGKIIIISIHKQS